MGGEKIWEKGNEGEGAGGDGAKRKREPVGEMERAGRKGKKESGEGR